MAAGPTYDLLNTTTLTSNQTGISFTSYSAAYTDLIFVIQYSSQINNYNLFFTANNLGANSYNHQDLSNTAIVNGTYSSVLMTRNIGAGTDMDHPGQTVFQIYNYANTTTFKPFTYTGGAMTDANDLEVNHGMGCILTTSALTTVKMQTNAGYFRTGTRASLYGIKAA